MEFVKEQYAKRLQALFGNASGHVLLADHAGSGKTLAYLLPLVQRLREQEVENPAASRQPRRPRMLVIVPTTELAVQANISNTYKVDQLF